MIFRRYITQVYEFNFKTGEWEHSHQESFIREEKS
jgi:hypothetical protein